MQHAEDAGCYEMLHMLACPPFPMIGLRDSDLRLRPSRYTCLEMITFILKPCMNAENCLKKTVDLAPSFLWDSLKKLELSL
jgi:hypothetical protein